MQVGDVLLFPWSAAFSHVTRDAYLQWVSARPAALLLIRRVIEKARELMDEH